MSQKLTCKLTCLACGAKEVEFEVRYRGQGEDLIQWIENTVKPAMTEAHGKRNMFCLGTKADLYIPAPQGAGVGQRVLN